MPSRVSRAGISVSAASSIREIAIKKPGAMLRIEPSDESRSARKADMTTSAEEVIACPTREIAKAIAVFGSSPARSRSR